jgi:hypothetical protein
MKFVLIVWLGVITNYAEHETLNDLPTCLERKARLEYYLAKVQSKLKVDCIQK